MSSEEGKEVKRQLCPQSVAAAISNSAIRMPAHVKFLIRHALIGFSIGLVAVALIVSQDLFRIGTLIGASSDRWLALGMLGFMFGLTFGSVQMGFAIMLLADTDD